MSGEQQPEWDELRMAWALWATDVQLGNMRTSWEDLSIVGQDAYAKDARALMKTLEQLGFEVRSARGAGK